MAKGNKYGPRGLPRNTAQEQARRLRQAKRGRRQACNELTAEAEKLGMYPTPSESEAT